MNRILLVSLMIVLSVLLSIFIPLPVNAVYTSSQDEALQILDRTLVLKVGYPWTFKGNVLMFIDENNRNIVPILFKGRTVLPVRFIAENFGADIKWDNDSKVCTITTDLKEIQIKQDDFTIKINGIIKNLDVPATNINDRLFLPLRVVAEALDKKVFFEDTEKTIFISDDNIYLSENVISEVNKWYLTENTERFRFNSISPNDIASLEKSVVQVNIYDNKNKLVSYGSGFCVGEGLFATNYHVVENAEKIVIKAFDDKEYDVEGIVASNLLSDLVITKTKKLPSPKIIPLKIYTADYMQKGDKVFAIGNPNGLSNTVSDGIVSAFRRFGGTPYIQITSPISPGSSGGPVFNEAGQVIGVVTSTLSTGELNFAVAIDELKKSLCNIKINNYSKIKILTKDDIFYKDENVSDKKIKELGEKFVKYIDNRDTRKYLDLFVYENTEREKEKASIESLFEDKFFKLKHESTEIIYKDKERAMMEVKFRMYTPEAADRYDVIYNCSLTVGYNDGLWRLTATEMEAESDKSITPFIKKNFLYSNNFYSSKEIEDTNYFLGDKTGDESQLVLKSCENFLISYLSGKINSEETALQYGMYEKSDAISEVVLVGQKLKEYFGDNQPLVENYSAKIIMTGLDKDGVKTACVELKYSFMDEDVSENLLLIRDNEKWKIMYFVQ